MTYGVSIETCQCGEGILARFLDAMNDLLRSATKSPMCRCKLIQEYPQLLEISWCWCYLEHLERIAEQLDDLHKRAKREEDCGQPAILVDGLVRI